MEVLTLASLIALGMRLVSFFKYLRARDWNASFTQAVVWSSGILLTFLAGMADITNKIVLWEGVPTLSDVNAASKILLGMMLLSTGSVVYEFKKAFDRNDSAAEPALLPPVKVVTPSGEAVVPPDAMKDAEKTPARKRSR